MSQVAAKKKLALQDERVKVIARFQEQGSVLRLESAAPAEEIAELVRLAHRMCFTEAALTGQVELTQRHHLNGQPLTL